MNGFKYPIKDKDIRIFEIVNDEDLEGYTVQKKRYITKGIIKASIQSNVASDFIENGKLSFQNYLTVYINKRLVDSTMFIEFKGKTYQIQSVDPVDFYNTEITIRAKLVSPVNLEVIENE